MHRYTVSYRSGLLGSSMVPSSCHDEGQWSRTAHLWFTDDSEVSPTPAEVPEKYPEKYPRYRLCLEPIVITPTIVMSRLHNRGAIAMSPVSVCGHSVVISQCNVVRFCLQRYDRYACNDFVHFHLANTMTRDSHPFVSCEFERHDDI